LDNIGKSGLGFYIIKQTVGNAGIQAITSLEDIDFNNSKWQQNSWIYKKVKNYCEENLFQTQYTQYYKKWEVKIYKYDSNREPCIPSTLNLLNPVEEQETIPFQEPKKNSYVLMQHQYWPPGSQRKRRIDDDRRGTSIRLCDIERYNYDYHNKFHNYDGPNRLGVGVSIFNATTTVIYKQKKVYVISILLAQCIPKKISDFHCHVDYPYEYQKNILYESKAFNGKITALALHPTKNNFLVCQDEDERYCCIEYRFKTSDLDPYTIIKEKKFNLPNEAIRIFYAPKNGFEFLYFILFSDLTLFGYNNKGQGFQILLEQKPNVGEDRIPSFATTNYFNTIVYVTGKLGTGVGPCVAEEEYRNICMGIIQKIGTNFIIKRQKNFYKYKSFLGYGGKIWYRPKQIGVLYGNAFYHITRNDYTPLVLKLTDQERDIIEKLLNRSSIEDYIEQENESTPISFTPNNLLKKYCKKTLKLIKNHWKLGLAIVGAVALMRYCIAHFNIKCYHA
jgi:hypothetical protein